MLLEFANLDKETQRRWDNNQFLEYGKLPYSEESSYLKSLVEVTPWERYEDYMLARLVAATPGKVGILHIQFPPQMAEDSRLHVHHHSDRVITVLEGAGQFLVAGDGKEIKSIPLERGNRLWMPRGIRHTFYAGSKGLVLESIHNPFFVFDDPKLLDYIDNEGFLDFAPDGSFMEVSRSESLLAC
jgi:mannose-6-phosphate isomerase-like protein (cupin superfamily)